MIESIKKNLTVFTVADPHYEVFCLSYIGSVLYHNPNAFVEIALDAPRAFEQANADALEVVRQHFGARFGFRRTGGLKHHNTQRFRLTPEHRNPYVYIGDIDILILEEIAPLHLRRMSVTKRRFSNIQRPGQRRLSGLHFTEWDAYYPLPPLRVGTHFGHDEVVLFETVEDAGHGMPDPAETWRPLHGYHMSLNREPGTGWSLNSPSYIGPYLNFRNSSFWQELFPFLNVRMQIVMSIVETVLGCHFPDRMADNKPLGLPRDWWFRV